MANILKTHQSDWKYVSEGGATIVLSYIGPSRIPFDGKVLRLRKSKRQHPEVVDQLRDSRLDEAPDDPTVDFQSKCMARLIPPEHLPDLETVLLDDHWLEQLALLQDPHRPQSRREEDGIDFTRKKGVLATDLIGGNELSVEIKPKWGFLPQPAHLSLDTGPIKLRTCRFCMHNNLRAQRGQSLPMKYCPLDLFSGDINRVSKAISNLWDSWSKSESTINNLKIFARGKLLHPSQVNEMLSDPGDTSGSLDHIKSAFTSALLCCLMQTPVLQILSKLQRTLDVLDIEGLSSLWRRTLSSHPSLASESAPAIPLGVSSPFLSSPEPNIIDWETFIDSFLSPFSSGLDHLQPKAENIRYYLLAYLLSATVKDCSIIVRTDLLQLGKTSSKRKNTDSVTVIDLDPKKMDKLNKWEKLDAEIVNAYHNNGGSKICIDAWRG